MSGFFYVLNGKKFKQVFIMSVAALFAAGIVYSERENVSVFAQNEPSAIYSIPTEKKGYRSDF